MAHLTWHSGATGNMMAASNLAFRDHREHDGWTNSSENSGNSLSVIKLLGRYAPVLEKLLSMPQDTLKCLSPTIPNEVISTGARCVKEDILNDQNCALLLSYGGHHPGHQQN